MTDAPDSTAILSTLNESLQRLQRSARRTVPMFVIGILATVIAAGVAVYYIMTLSSDLRDARRKLDQSQTALSETQGKLAILNESLRQAQLHVVSPQAAQSIQSALTDVSSSQQSLTAVSSSLNAATARIAPAGPPAGTCRLQVNGVSYINGNCEIVLEKGGSFQIWTIGRTGPSASVVRQGTYGLGSWQAGPGQPQIDLGQLQRKGACWENGDNQICAWK
jgi:hypothetical protein